MLRSFLRHHTELTNTGAYLHIAPPYATGSYCPHYLGPCLRPANKKAYFIYQVTLFQFIFLIFLKLLLQSTDTEI